MWILNEKLQAVYRGVKYAANASKGLRKEAFLKSLRSESVYDLTHRKLTTHMRRRFAVEAYLDLSESE